MRHSQISYIRLKFCTLQLPSFKSSILTKPRLDEALIASSRTAATMAANTAVVRAHVDSQHYLNRRKAKNYRLAMKTHSSSALCIVATHVCMRGCERRAEHEAACIFQEAPLRPQLLVFWCGCSSRQDGAQHGYSYGRGRCDIRSAVSCIALRSFHI